MAPRVNSSLPEESDGERPKWPGGTLTRRMISVGGAVGGMVGVAFRGGVALRGWYDCSWLVARDEVMLWCSGGRSKLAVVILMEPMHSSRPEPQSSGRHMLNLTCIKCTLHIYFCRTVLNL
jgi:hypothetical protein